MHRRAVHVDRQAPLRHGEVGDGDGAAAGGEGDGYLLGGVEAVRLEEVQELELQRGADAGRVQ